MQRGVLGGLLRSLLNPYCFCVHVNIHPPDAKPSPSLPHITHTRSQFSSPPARECGSWLQEVEGGEG